MKLSIVIPVFNEEKTIGTVLEKVSDINLPLKATKEIIVVDDGSHDATPEIVKKFLKTHKEVSFIQHKQNAGKGSAVKSGIEKARGDYIIIQDADLEYNTSDIPKLFHEAVTSKNEVVYGTRLQRLPHFEKEERTGRFLLHYVGNKFLSLVTSVLYGQWVTDMETCYKLFPKSAMKGIHLYSRGFEFEPEITVKLIKAGFKIHEIPIQTKPRSYTEGKKLNTFKDGTKALWTLLKYRF